MCVYFVAMLCAGRFGLGWAHDEFIFACHMFMHSHAYVPSILYILIYLLFGTFFIVSLSFSPSYVSCVMAPKRKFIPSRNPLHSGASSSSSPSNSTPSHVRFHNEKAKSDFLENFSRRSIHSERQVILSDFSDTNLPSVIHSRGWDSLCGVLITCPSVIIQEFYSNRHGFDYSIPQFSTCVRGIRIVVTPDIVSEVLHVPRVVHPDYPSCQHLRIVSKDELSSLFCETPSSWGDRQTPHAQPLLKVQES